MYYSNMDSIGGLIIVIIITIFLLRDTAARFPPEASCLPKIHVISYCDSLKNKCRKCDNCCNRLERPLF